MSQATAIRTVVPAAVLLFGSSPRSNKAPSSSAVPNNAVRIHAGASSGAGCTGSYFTGDSGIALSNAISAQQLPAYDKNSSFPYGNPVGKYFGLISAGES